MIKLSRSRLTVLTPLCSVLLLAAQSSGPEFERELQAGKQAAQQSSYADAVTHFTKANQLQRENCSQCRMRAPRGGANSGRIPSSRSWEAMISEHCNLGEHQPLVTRGISNCRSKGVISWLRDRR